MAWRPTEHLIEGELDNTTPDKVTGWMRFAGMDEKVTFDLQGNFHRDIRGAKTHLTGDGQADDPDAGPYMASFSPQQTGETAFDFMKTLGADGGKFSEYMKGTTFMIATPKLLDKVVQQIDKLPLDKKDTKGDLYEYMLSKIAEAGTNGQFRTPRHIIRMMVELLDPKEDDTICDPSLGTAGFLVAASEFLRENHKDWFLEKEFRNHYNTEMFNGMEIDPSMMRIASMNLQLHGIETPNLMGGSALAESNDKTGKYSVILANPPFKGALDYEEVEKSLLQITKSREKSKTHT